MASLVNSKSSIRVIYYVYEGISEQVRAGRNEEWIEKRRSVLERYCHSKKAQGVSVDLSSSGEEKGSIFSPRMS